MHLKGSFKLITFSLKRFDGFELLFSSVWKKAEYSIVLHPVTGGFSFLCYSSMMHSGSFFCNAAIPSSLCFILGVFVRLSFVSFLKEKRENTIKSLLD